MLAIEYNKLIQTTIQYNIIENLIDLNAIVSSCEKRNDCTILRYYFNTHQKNNLIY